jgi:hypothetical protein
MGADFRLSTPELVALLRALRVRTVMGLPPNPLEGMTEEQIINLLAKGLHRFCHLRQYGDPSDGNNPRLKEWGRITAILTVSGFCTSSLVVSQRGIRDQKKCWRAWHRSEPVKDFFVEYRLNPLGFHEFTAIESKDRLYGAVWEHLPHGLFPEGSGRNSEVASKCLLESSNFELEDQDLLEAIQSSGTWTTVSSIKYNGQRPDALSFMSTEKKAWLVTEINSRVFFVPCTMGKLKLGFLNLITSFME